LIRKFMLCFSFMPVEKPSITFLIMIYWCGRSASSHAVRLCWNQQFLSAKKIVTNLKRGHRNVGYYGVLEFVV
jgi:hypothetical protein